MGDPSMEIRLDQLPEGEAVAFRFDESHPDFAEVLLSVAESKSAPMKGATELRLESWPERLDIVGQIQARGPFTCVRCLTRFEMVVERHITHILVRNLDVADSSEEEIELNRSDLDRSELRGDSVKLADVLREELLLAMPMKAVCRDECEGICSGCGVELNNESCICKPQIDERWAALAALKTDES